MTDSEKRRIKLLEQTRNMYSDRKTPPAIHPRYSAPYQELYGEETEAFPGTFGIRAFLCFMLFAAFVAMDYQDGKVFNVSSERIVQEITYDLDVEEVWKNL